ncbi:PepSY domain-containing protein [Micrococcales bacterium 31B]|nr:PepSY domain-containing protein [Micrococcales bacterium 31B]
MSALKKNKKALLGASIAGLVLLGGVAGTASIAQAYTANHSSVSTTHQATLAQTDKADTPDTPEPGDTPDVADSAEQHVTGSLKAPSENGEQNDAAEQAALQKIATITSAQAESAAKAAVPGTVSETKLGEEDGWVVYTVSVTDGKGAATDVMVDAGSGKVLGHEAGDTETNDDHGGAPDSADNGGAGDQAQGNDAPEPGDTPDVAGAQSGQ